jgi:hypothetical protein
MRQSLLKVGSYATNWIFHQILYGRILFQSKKKGKAKISCNFICVNFLFCSGCLLGWDSNGHIWDEQQLRHWQGNQNNNANVYNSRVGGQGQEEALTPLALW